MLSSPICHLQPQSSATLLSTSSAQLPLLTPRPSQLSPGRCVPLISLGSRHPIVLRPPFDSRLRRSALQASNSGLESGDTPLQRAYCVHRPSTADTGEVRDFAALSLEQRPAYQQRGGRGRRRSMALFSYIQLALFKPLDVFFRGRIRERYYSHASSGLLDGSEERQSLNGRSVHSVLLGFWVRLGFSDCAVRARA